MSDSFGLIAEAPTYRYVTLLGNEWVDLEGLAPSELQVGSRCSALC